MNRAAQAAHTPRRPWAQPARFVGAGALVTAAGYGWYAAALALGASVPVATAAAMVFNVPLGFVAHGRLAFGGAPRGRLWRYAAVWALVGACNAGLIEGLMAALGLDAYTAGIVAIAPIAILSYGLQRRFVFGRH